MCIRDSDKFVRHESFIISSFTSLQPDDNVQICGCLDKYESCLMLDQNPTDQTPAPNQGGENQRADWMGVLGRAPAKSLEAKMKALGDATSFDWLRQPEIGAIMVQGRAGGTGAAFNMGEMTVTRCALRLAGEAESVGHGYVQGRDARHAELAALADALLQTERQAEVMDAVIRPLKAEEAAKRLAARRKAGATKVDFFTMVRAEG